MLLSAGGLLAVAVQSAPATATDYEALAASAVVYVDDDGANDPGANDSAVSDPLEDGSREHPFDSIQEGIRAVASGGQILVAGGTYGEALTIDKNLTLSGGYNGEDWDQPRQQGWRETTVDAVGLDQSVIRILNVDATLDWLTITHGNAPAGGGIYCEGGPLTLRACRIVDNRTWDGGPAESGGNGGGIFCLSSPNLILDDCFVGSNATGGGGARSSGDGDGGEAGYGAGLYCELSSGTIAGCTFESNGTGSGGNGAYTNWEQHETYGRGGDGGRGGGICLVASGIEIEDSQFNFNSTGSGGEGRGYAAGGDGGSGAALCILGSAVEIHGSGFVSNHTGPGGTTPWDTYGPGGRGGSGGALCLQSDSLVEISDCTFDRNTTGAGGDAGYTTGGTAGFGGALYCDSSSLTARLSSFTNNATGSGGNREGRGADGGGVYSLSSSVELTECELAFNAAGRAGYYRYPRPGGRGGGACFVASDVILDQCLIRQNRTADGLVGETSGGSGPGGGVLFDTCSGVQVRNCVIAGNRTGSTVSDEGYYGLAGHGGGLAIVDSPSRVEDCLLYDNATGSNPVYEGKGGNGGGIYVDCDGSMDAAIVGCTIVGNQCGSGGFGATGERFDGRGGGIYADPMTIVVNSILWANTQGNVLGCNVDNVRFCVIADWMAEGVNHNTAANPRFADATARDYRLMPGSPCIDRGDNASVSPTNPADLDGNPRIVGQAVDIGAYESPADTAPGDVTEFAATPGDGQIALSWTNRGDVDFAGVRILRKEGGYPDNPTDGELVYDGPDAACVDGGLTNGTDYYYTAFSYDEARNYSAGSTVRSTPIAPGVVDTVGYTTVFPNVSEVANRRAVPVVMRQSGSLTSISICHQGGTGNAILAVYADSGGRPETRLGVTASTPVLAAEGWQTIALQEPVAVAAGETIWLAWVFENDPGLRWVAGGPGRAISAATWSGGMPAAFGAAATFSAIYSVYATFGTGVDTTAPASVTSLAAAPSDGRITLTWTNPRDADFTGATVLRKEGSYPVDPTDGVLVYDGPASTCVDSGLPNGVPFYYAVFSHDEASNHAAPATVAATPVAGGSIETVGYSTIFPNVAYTVFRRAMPVVTSQSGSLVSISVYHQGGTGSAILAVYDDADGLPGNRLGVTDSTPISRTAGWQTISLQSPVEVSAGETIWLAWVFEGDPGMRWVAGGPGRAVSTATWADGMPDAFGPATSFDAIYSVYATYSAGQDVTPPGNVVALTAAPADGRIILIWTKPADGDYAGVRIVRREGDYPSDPTDGVVVYEGAGLMHVDAGLANGTTYFYRAFSYDEAPNYSGGALAAATPIEGSVSNTIGDTTVFPNVSAIANRRAVRFVARWNGSLTSISIYHQGGTGDAVLAVYGETDSSYGPGARLGVTSPTPIHSEEGWQTFVLETPVTVSSGQWIWLAWVFENDPGMRWSSGGDWRALSPDVWSDGMPETFGPCSWDGVAYSIYATYGPYED